MKMSITRALAELKLLAERIDKGIHANSWVTSQIGDKIIPGYKTMDEYNQKVKAAFDSVNALIKRRQAIKAAVVQSNATTEIVVAGVKMTVAEAIERKSSIAFEKTLLMTLSQAYTSTLGTIQRENQRVQERLDKLVETSFGADVKVKDDQYDSIAIPFLKKNEAKLVDPIGVKDVIEELSKSISDFEMEVDFTLSTSNAITMIEIPD